MSKTPHYSNIIVEYGFNINYMGLLELLFGKFKRYEDASLEYIGINRHASETRIGLNDTVITKDEYQRVFVNRP